MLWDKDRKKGLVKNMNQTLNQILGSRKLSVHYGKL